MRPRFYPILAMLGLFLYPGLADACLLRVRLARERTCVSLHRPAARLFQRRWRHHRRGVCDSVAAAVALGDSLLGKNDFDGAIAAYTKAIQLDPKCAKAYYERGRAYERKNDLDSAFAAVAAIKKAGKIGCINRINVTTEGLRDRVERAWALLPPAES